MATVDEWISYLREACAPAPEPEPFFMMCIRCGAAVVNPHTMVEARIAGEQRVALCSRCRDAVCRNV